MQVSGLRVHAMRAADASTNWEFAQPAGENSQPAAEPVTSARPDAAQTADQSEPLDFSVARLHAEGSVFSFEDHSSGETLQIELAALDAEGFNLRNETFSLQARGHLGRTMGDDQSTAPMEFSSRVAVDRSAQRVSLADADLELSPADGDATTLQADAIDINRDGQLVIRGGNFSKGALALGQMEATIRRDEGLTTIDSLTASLHGGSLQASGRHDSRNERELRLKLKLTGSDVRSALLALGEPPIADGKLDAALSIRASGYGEPGWQATLAGPVSISVREPVLHDINVQQLLCKASATLNQEQLTAAFAAETRLDSLEASLDFRDGVGEFNRLSAGMPGMVLDGIGIIDIPEQRLQLQLNTRLTRDPGELDNACRMTRKMLAIEWPITCRGKFHEDPQQWCGVTSEDLSRIASQLATQKFGDKFKDKLKSFFGNDN